MISEGDLWPWISRGGRISNDCVVVQSCYGVCYHNAINVDVKIQNFDQLSSGYQSPSTNARNVGIDGSSRIKSSSTISSSELKFNVHNGRTNQDKVAFWLMVVPVSKPCRIVNVTNSKTLSIGNWRLYDWNASTTVGIDNISSCAVANSVVLVVIRSTESTKNANEVLVFVTTNERSIGKDKTR
jgi:hypothetical protein